MSGTSPKASSGPALSVPPTRTLGFIKNHALKHRLPIERRLLDAGFTIVKERQMQFNPDSDAEFLLELFGDDASALGEDPVWIYVLERARAAEVLQSLLGEDDPEDARVNSPNSIRALFGTNSRENAFGRAIDPTAVDILFASSPVWSGSELPSEGRDFNSIRSVNSSFLAALRKSSTPERDSDAARYANSYINGDSSVTGSSGGTPTRVGRSPTDGKVPFKARPVPASNAPGAVQPRMTKAAALRMGIALPTVEKRRESVDSTRTFENVPGHKRVTHIAVASTAPPTIAPRATRASSLREGKPVEVVRPRASLDSVFQPKELFKNVPGHKRTETFEVASIKPPTVAPRQNRSALLRQQKEVAAAPPSSFMFKSPPTLSRTPSLTSRSSVGSLSDSSTRPALTRTTSLQERRASVGSTPPRPPSATTTRGPDIAPRSNRSAMLRAAKMAANAKPARA